jgi:hypothetical protein
VSAAEQISPVELFVHGTGAPRGCAANWLSLADLFLKPWAKFRFFVAVHPANFLGESTAGFDFCYSCHVPGAGLNLVRQSLTLPRSIFMRGVFIALQSSFRWLRSLLKVRFAGPFTHTARTDSPETKVSAVEADFSAGEIFCPI